MLKTRATTSGRWFVDCDGSSASCISGHEGLHVMVMKSEGRPNLRTYDIASCIRWCMYRGPPVNELGKMTFCPIFVGLPSSKEESDKLLINSVSLLTYREEVRQ